MKQRDRLLSYLTENLSKEIRAQINDELENTVTNLRKDDFLASVVYIMLEVEGSNLTVADLEVEYRTNKRWWRKKLKYNFKNSTVKYHNFHNTKLSRKIIEEGIKSREE